MPPPLLEPRHFLYDQHLVNRVVLPRRARKCLQVTQINIQLHIRTFAVDFGVAPNIPALAIVGRGFRIPKPA
jgi:hypothetical protein